MVKLATKGTTMSKRNRKPSPAQIAANKANAQLSTGPKTPEGKAVSSQNSSRATVISAKAFMELTIQPGECVNQFAVLQQSVLDTLRPQSQYELHLAEQIVRNEWNILRLQASEHRLTYFKILGETTGSPTERLAKTVAASATDAEAQHLHRLIAYGTRNRGTLQRQLNTHRDSVKKYQSYTAHDPQGPGPLDNIPVPPANIRGQYDFDHYHQPIANTASAALNPTLKTQNQANPISQSLTANFPTAPYAKTIQDPQKPDLLPTPKPQNGD